MRKILLILLLIPAFADAQLSSIVLRNDTLFSYNPSTNVWTQLTKTIPPRTGQGGKILSNNSIDYTWITPDYAATNHTHTGVYQPADADLTTYAASAGLYFAAFIYNNSAQTTAPGLASGVALNNLAMASTAMGFTNSAKLHGTSSGTDLPASITMASITASTIPSWVGAY